MTFVEQMAAIRRHQRVAPVQVVPIAEELELAVWYDKTLPDNISGILLKNDELSGPSGFAIIANGKHAPVRRRFTIAHEIAHFVLHRDLIAGGIEDDALYRSGLSNRIEAAANRMAADVLMPWRLLNRALAEGRATVDTLAELFNVSRSAMSIRLGVPFETAA